MQVERLEMSRLYDASALQITAIVPGPGPESLRTRRAHDADVLGSWRHGLNGIAYEVTIPPAGMVWNSDFAVVEMQAWVGRHVIRHVQEAFWCRNRQRLPCWWEERCYVERISS